MLTLCNNTVVDLNPFQLDGCWQAKIIEALNNTLTSDPEELDLLGCLNTTGGWLKFGYESQLDQNSKYWTTVNPHWKGLERETTGRIYKKLDQIGKPARQLPEGIFLICGDRAWNGVPANPHGGPCYLGQLTLFHPNLHQLMRMMAHTRSKRNIHDLNCEGVEGVTHWSKATTVFVSAILPGATAARAMTTLKQLACWAHKEINLTSQILDDLSADVTGVNHAVLQNRAAIEFLFLAQGHGCDEFEGMCCMNLSDHSESIHKRLKILKDGLHAFSEWSDPFTQWLSKFGITGWMRTILMEGLRLLVVIVIGIVIFGCALSCVKKGLEKVVHTAWLVQKEKGGIVENILTDLTEKGHAVLLEAILHDPAYVTEDHSMSLNEETL